MRKLLFPTPARLFPGQRWANIVLRAIHLVAISGCAGGYLFELPQAVWHNFWLAALFSGTALVALYLYSSALWMLQLKGLAIGIKLALLWLAYLYPAFGAELFISVVIISALIAHAPGAVRGWRWLPWRPDGQS